MTTKDTNHICHNCSEKLIEIFEYKNLNQITSDCKPWHNVYPIHICLSCELVQKNLSENWYKDISSIYNSYTIYSQSDGIEQVIFDDTKGRYRQRSEIIYDWVNENYKLKTKSKLLDIGCGTGVTLKTFSNTKPEWELYGLESSENNYSHLTKIKNFKKLYTEIPDQTLKFDVISFIHSLEHIPQPTDYLIKVRKNIKEDGILIIQVPDILNSPFDPMITDHSSHFSLTSLENCLKMANYFVIKSTNNLIKKELSVIARPNNNYDDKVKLNSENKINLVIDQLNFRAKWLSKIVQQASRINGKIGIFGSSISGTWLASYIKNVDFFVEEDTNKIGRQHLNIPIISPESIPSNSNVLMPLRFDIALNIKNRLNIKELLLPPALK